MPVWQALFLAKRIDRTGVPVEHSLVNRADPQIGFRAGKRRDTQTIQRRMQGRQMLAAVNQDSPPLCSDQKVSGGRWEYRGDPARFGILRTNQPEITAIKGQQSFLRGGYHKFRFPAVRQQNLGKSDEWRRWQVPARDKLPGRSATKIVLPEAARPAYIKVVLKARCLLENRRGADYLEAASRWRSQRMRFESNLSFRVNLFRGELQSALGPPSCKPNQQQNEYPRARDNRSNQQFPCLPHWFPQNTSA